MHLYPKIEPYSTEFLKVSDLHTLYLEESGNPQGVPVIFLHGGPGGGTGPAYRQFFDPAFYRIILFDQRGAGHSTPKGETRDNTTAALVADMEQIRVHLGIEQWLVFGGSWGSTLAMAYGVTHPSRCLGFILRGIFLMQESEINWFLCGTRQHFPDYWTPLMQKLLAATGKSTTPVEALSYQDILNLLEQLLHSDNKEAADEVFASFGRFEQDIMTLLPIADLKSSAEDCRTIAKLEHHFFAHNQHEFDGFLTKLKAVQHLPCTIVHGRYDMVCPPLSAYQVHQAWPGSKLVMVPDGGHSAMDPAITRALVVATDAFRDSRQSALEKASDF